MKIWRRAFLYLTRNRKKTVIFVSILTFLTALVFLCVSVGNAAKESVQKLREQMGGYFKIETDYAHGKAGRVNDDLIQRVMEAGGIQAFNGVDIQHFRMEDIELLPGRFHQEGNEQAKIARFSGNTDSSRNEYFMLKYYSLSKGRHIGPKDKGKVLISDVLAEKNHLSIGDVFHIRYDEERLSREKSASVTSHAVEVVGIYHIDSTLNYQSSNAAESEMEENFIFTDTSLVRDMYREATGAETDFYTSGVSFFVENPKELDRILDEVLQWQDYDWNAYSVVKNNKTYEDSAAPLERLNGLVVMMIAVVVSVSGGMLSLILFLWMRERVHEMGIYFSVGIRKIEVVFQHMFENMLVGALAFVFAFGISTAASGLAEQIIEESFLKNEEAEAALEKEIRDDFEFEIRIGAPETAKVAGVGFLILFLSTGVSVVPVVRLQPKDVFSKMS